MTKYRIIAGLWILLLVGIAALIVFRDDRRLSEDIETRQILQNDTESLSHIIADDTDAKRVELAKKKKMMNIALMYSTRKAAESEKEYSYEELHEITGENYFEMAPVVLEDMFQEQESDTGWTDSIQKDADVFVSEITFEGTVLNAIDCRKTLCKVEFDHDDHEKRKSFLKGPVNVGPWIVKSGEAFGGFKEDANGNVHSYVYFTKEGDFDTFWEMRKNMARIIENNPT